MNKNMPKWQKNTLKILQIISIIMIGAGGGMGYQYVWGPQPSTDSESITVIRNPNINKNKQLEIFIDGKWEPLTNKVRWKTISYKEIN